MICNTQQGQSFIFIFVYLQSIKTLFDLIQNPRMVFYSFALVVIVGQFEITELLASFAIYFEAWNILKTIGIVHNICDNPGDIYATRYGYLHSLLLFWLDYDFGEMINTMNTYSNHQCNFDLSYNIHVTITYSKSCEFICD